MRTCLTIIIALLFAGACLAEPPRYAHRTAARPAVVKPAVKAYVAPHHHGHRKVVVVDETVLLFDPHAFDRFTFYGPTAASPGVFLGVDGRGVEVRGFPAAQAAQSGQDDEDQRPVVGYEAGAPAQLRKPPALASLTPSCASCHTGAKARGEFVLFDAPGRVSPRADWKRALAAVASGRMPPPNSGKPVPSQEDRAEMARKAGATPKEQAR